MAQASLAIAIAALGVAVLAGTPLGEAAAEQLLPRNSVGTLQLRDGAVTAAKVRDRSLLARDFKAGQLPRGPAGPQGPPGTIEGAGAGGDLTGTYPAPTLAAGSVSSAEVADGSLRLVDAAVLSGQARVDVPALKAHSCVASGVAVRGVRPYDRTLVLPTQNLPLGAFVTQVFNTSAANRIHFRVCNATTRTVDPVLGGWAYVVWRP